MQHPRSSADRETGFTGIKQQLQSVGTSAACKWAADRFRGKPGVYLLGNHEYYDGRLDTTLAEARREAQGSNVHLLDVDELVIDGVRFLGATPRT